VLTKSRRRCCLCFWLDGIDDPVKGQIAHVNKDRSDSKEENLAFLCLRHHDEYDSIPSQSKGLREKEVRHWREELYREMAFKFREYTSVAEQRKETFAYLESIMADLFVNLRAEMRERPLARYVVLVHQNCTVSSEWQLLELYYYDIPQLREKMRILHNHGLIQREADADDSYWLTEELAAYFRQSQ